MNATNEIHIDGKTAYVTRTVVRRHGFLWLRREVTVYRTSLSRRPSGGWQYERNPDRDVGRQFKAELEAAYEASLGEVWEVVQPLPRARLLQPAGGPGVSTEHDDRG